MNSDKRLAGRSVFLLAVVLGCAGPVAGADDAFLAVLDAELESVASGENRTMDRLFDLRESREDVNQALVDLLDYYLGAGAGEILGDFITTQGSKIAPLLEKKREGQLSCLPKYISICRDSREARNRKIDRMLDAIRRGIVLKAAD